MALLRVARIAIGVAGNSLADEPRPDPVEEPFGRRSSGRGKPRCRIFETAAIANLPGSMRWLATSGTQVLSIAGECEQALALAEHSFAKTGNAAGMAQARDLPATIGAGRGCCGAARVTADGRTRFRLGNQSWRSESTARRAPDAPYGADIRTRGSPSAAPTAISATRNGPIATRRRAIAALLRCAISRRWRTAVSNGRAGLVKQ